MEFAVLFDMDGLMLDTERVARKAWTRALADRGFQLEELEYLRLVGRTVEDARMILGELFGPQLPFVEVFDKRQAYYDEDLDLNGVPIKPGLMELLDFLEKRNVPKAVASSTPCWFAKVKLARAQINHRFLTTVCGDDVARGKPAPDLFLEAARRIQIAPERCVVLEDSEAGVQAAQAAGMISIMVPDLKQPTPEIMRLPYRIVPSLHDVIAVMEELIKYGLPRVE